MPEGRKHAAAVVLGHVVFVALAVLSVKHAVLRMTYGDTAYQLVKWILDPGISIEAHRYTALLPQLAVSAAMLVGADLHTLIVIGSISHVLVPYAVFLLCAHGWRAPLSALGCALAAVLCSRFTFYSPVLEANYLLCYPFLLFGFVERRARDQDWSTWRSLQGIALLLIPLIVHPAGCLVMLFGVVFQCVRHRMPVRSFIPLLLITVSWPIVARLIFPPTAYETGLYEAAFTNLSGSDGARGWASLDFLRIHTGGVSFTYVPALVLWILVVIGFIALKQYRSGLLAVAGPVAFVGVFVIAFAQGDAGIMLDRGILPVATILALCVVHVHDALPSGRWRQVATFILTATLFLKLRDVSFGSRPFRDRDDAIAALIADARAQRIVWGIVPTDDPRAKAIGVSWALPCESLLLSSLAGPAESRCLVMDGSIPLEAAQRGGLYLFDRSFPITRKDERYFQADPSPYVRMDRR